MSQLEEGDCCPICQQLACNCRRSLSRFFRILIEADKAARSVVHHNPKPITPEPQSRAVPDMEDV